MARLRNVEMERQDGIGAPNNVMWLEMAGVKMWRGSVQDVIDAPNNVMLLAMAVIMVSAAEPGI